MATKGDQTTTAGRARRQSSSSYSTRDFQDGASFYTLCKTLRWLRESESLNITTCDSELLPHESMGATDMEGSKARFSCWRVGTIKQYVPRLQARRPSVGDEASDATCYLARVAGSKMNRGWSFVTACIMVLKI